MNRCLRRRCRAAASLVFLMGASDSQALLITELMASNSASIQDEDGEHSDWLELFNETASTVSLDGLYLTDEEAVPTKWRFPSVTLGAGQYLVVWASDKNRATPGQPLHTNFRLSASGEYLGLVAADGTTVLHEYQPSFEAVAENRTYGLASDLVSARCFVIATPGAANDESLDCATTSPVAFSAERGFYEVPFELTLSTATPGATIHYTLDGSDPTPAHGTVYAGPIEVATTAMVRAMAFGPGLDPTSSITHTYIFLEDVLTQSIADQPPEYLFPVADYEMDPAVVNDPRYADEIVGDLKAIPTMSIVTDVDHLFGPANGIYTHRSGEGVAWERPTSVELIPAEGSAQPGFQINCGIRIQGGVSRLSDSGKYNLRLLFKSVYGPSKLVYPLFPGSSVDSFDTVVLTATHGHSWHAGFSDAEYIRDTWLKDTQLAMGQASSHCTYVHLYLNGRYWGLYRPTERPSAPFLASWYGGVEEDYDALNSGQAVDGDRDAWETMMNLAKGPVDTLAGYDAVLEYLDVVNFADYMISNIFAGNYDWPDKNWYAGRKREPGAGYRFFNWDGEETLMSVGANRTALGAADSPGALYQLLRRSPEFRLLFGDRVHKHLQNGGALTPEATAARWRARRDEIFGAIVGESARWGDGRRTGNPYTRDIEWIIENQRLLLSYFPARTAVQLDQFRKADLYPSIDAPVFSRHGGEFFPGEELTMTTAAGAIWLTLDGSDPRLPGGAVASGALPYAGPIELSTGATVKARALSGGTWSAVTEADFSPASPIRITELQYNPSAGVGAEFLEIRNIGSTPASLAGLQLTTGVTFAFASTALAPGAHGLVVENAAVFESTYGAGHPVLGQYSGRLDNGGERIVLVGPASTIQDFEYDDAWYPSTDGGGKSLVIRGATADLSVWSQASGWRASAPDAGTPGVVEAALCANGIDDDGDGATDLADAGCESAASDSETTACDDGIDNDGDGGVDLADAQCTSGSHTSEAPDAGDTYFCYTTRSAAEFAPVAVALGNELAGTVQHEVRRPSSLCLAGVRDGEAAVEPDTHLRAYEIRELPDEPRHVVLTSVRYEDGLGPYYVDIASPTRILVPANVGLSVPVAAPAFGSHGVDHYKCYRTKTTRSQPKYLPPNAQIHFEDVLQDRDYLLRPPTRVCIPSSLDGSIVKTPERHLLCYKASRGRLMPRHAAQDGVHAADTLGDDVLSTRKEEEVCIPAVPTPE